MRVQLRRREFLRLAGAAATAPAWPLAGLAQATPEVPRVALVSGGASLDPMGGSTITSIWAAFTNALRKHGLVEGQTLILDRYALNGDTSQSDRLARQILDTSPDVLFTAAAPATSLAAALYDQALPIVSLSGDPVGQGVVINLARPGSNMTAISTTASDSAEGKNLGLLREALPAARSVAYIQRGTNGTIAPGVAGYYQAANDAASRLGIALTLITADDTVGEPEYRRAFSGVREKRIEMVQLGTNGSYNAVSSTLAQLALENRLPVIGPFSSFAQAGGLMSYGSQLEGSFASAAEYVFMILNGARAGDLPVLQPTVFDLVINLKTARAIGVTIPASLLAQATEVIQ